MWPAIIMAIASVASAAMANKGQTPGQTMFPEAIKTGSKPMMQVGNPYQAPMATTAQNPYGQMMNPYQKMYMPNSLSSALGRYGGLG